MSALIYAPVPTTTDAGDPVRSAVRASWRAPLRLVVVLASALSGGVAAHILLDDPGVQATVVNAATGSAGAVLATLTAYLFVRRMHRTLALADALLGAALTLLPAVSVVAATFSALHSAADRELVQFMVGPGAGVVASLGLVAAAMAGTRSLSGTRATDGIYAAALVGGLVVAGAALLADRVPEDTRPAALTLVHLVAAGGTGAAAVTFFRASAPGRDPVLAWLAVAAAIVAAAHLTDALLPWSSGDPLSGGSLVQVAGWLALLVGGIRDFEWAHRRDAEVAVLEERRRLARELHDGLAQELAYITNASRGLAGHPGAKYLAAAAERALEESRAAILALTRAEDEPLEQSITVAAHSIGARAGVDVHVAARPGLDAPAEVRQAMVRVLREALYNAVRHGGATTVRVSLDGPAPLVMAIADDGIGFDPAATARRADSLGLESMRERALNLGGHLSIESAIGHGTTVAMVVP
jgi:signal transduction histidine kinase